METRRDVFQAIADPTRREIIGLLAKKPQNLNAIAEKFDISRQAVSLHVKILEECGLLNILQEGRERFCHLQPKKLDAVSHWLEPLRRQWESRFEQLDELLARKPLKAKSKSKHKSR